MSFEARFGSGCDVQYKKEFEKVLSEVFESSDPKTSLGNDSIVEMRKTFEGAGLLFPNEANQCRDVVSVAIRADDATKAVVYLVQLRDGIVAGKFIYNVEVASGFHSEEDFSDVLQPILDRHYTSAGIRVPGNHSFFPDEILTEFSIIDTKSLKQSIRHSRRQSEPERRGAIEIRIPRKRGPRSRSDERAVEFAKENAKQEAIDASFKDQVGVPATSLDGTASSELAKLLSLEK